MAYVLKSPNTVPRIRSSININLRPWPARSFAHSRWLLAFAFSPSTPGGMTRRGGSGAAIGGAGCRAPPTTIWATFWRARWAGLRPHWSRALWVGGASPSSARRGSLPTCTESGFGLTTAKQLRQLLLWLAPLPPPDPGLRACPGRSSPACCRLLPSGSCVGV